MAARDCADKKNAARMLEESKTAVLSRMKATITAIGDVPDTHAERQVKASSAWQDYINTMCRAIHDADLAQIEVETIRMRYWEHQAGDANRRAEMRL